MDVLYYLILIIYVIFLILLSILFVKKYIELKKKEFLTMGFLFLTVVLIYIFYIISFFMIILIKKPLDPFFYIVSTSLNVFFLLFWLITFSGLVLKSKKNMFLIISILFLALLEVIYYSLFFLYGESALIVSIERGLWVKSTPYVIFFLIIIFTVFFLTAIIFIITAIKSKIKEIKTKGEILLFGLICLILGTIFESVIPLVGLFFIFTRIFQIIGVLFIFIGFTLPKWVKKLFNLEIID